MDFPLSKVAVDWSLIDIWCCGKFHSSVDICDHTELRHGKHGTSSQKMSYRTLRSSFFGTSFLHNVEDPPFPKSPETEQIGNRDCKRKRKESEDGNDVTKFPSPKRRHLSKRKSKCNAVAELANTTRVDSLTTSPDISDLKNLFDDTNDIEGDRKISMQIVDDKQDTFSDEAADGRIMRTSKINDKDNGERIVNLKEEDNGVRRSNSLREHKKKCHPGEFLNIPEVRDGDLKFQCEFCHDFFGMKDQVLNHVRIHHEDSFQTWIETVRKSRTKVKKQLPIQVIGHFLSQNHPDQTTKPIQEICLCHLCEHKCANVHSLREHKKKHHPGEFLNIPEVGDGDWKFKCEFCNDLFKTKDEVLNHVKTNHKDNFQTWIEAVRKWKIRTKVRKPSPVHVVEHVLSQNCIDETPKPIQEMHRCNHCEQEFVNVHYLREHRKKHHPGEFLNIPEVGDGEFKFKCEFCGENFGTKDEILAHVRIQHKDALRPWIERVKQKKNENQSRFHKLLKNYYKQDGNTVKCNFCPEVFHAVAFLKNFKDHMATVHKDKYTQELEFVCDVCGAAFLRKSALSHHSQTHEPAVNCPNCNKSFATKLSLRKHQKLSCNNEVALKFCDACGKGFKTSYDVKVHHERVHLNIRPFKCTICGNSFKTLSAFQTHCTGVHNLEKAKSKEYLLTAKPGGEDLNKI